VEPKAESENLRHLCICSVFAVKKTISVTSYPGQLSLVIPPSLGAMKSYRMKAVCAWLKSPTTTNIIAESYRVSGLNVTSKIEGVVNVSRSNEHPTTSKLSHVTRASSTKIWYHRNSISSQRTVFTNVLYTINQPDVKLIQYRIVSAEVISKWGSGAERPKHASPALSLRA